MPLPLTVSCFSKIQIGFTFLVPAQPGSPGKTAVKRVCVCVCVCTMSLWSRYDRHFLRITRHDALSQMANIYRVFSNEIESVSLRKCPRVHGLTNRAYLSAIAVTNISNSFTRKMAAKINWHRYGTKLRHRRPMYTAQMSNLPISLLQ